MSSFNTDGVSGLSFQGYNIGQAEYDGVTALSFAGLSLVYGHSEADGVTGLTFEAQANATVARVTQVAKEVLARASATPQQNNNSLCLIIGPGMSIAGLLNNLALIH